MLFCRNSSSRAPLVLCSSLNPLVPAKDGSMLLVLGCHVHWEYRKYVCYSKSQGLCFYRCLFILLLLLQLVSIHHSKSDLNMDMEEHSGVASVRKENGRTSYSLGHFFFPHSTLLWPWKKR